jgi:D-alanyl-D-alanine carboxypeptidase (penicillin-binding protein 5/6)
MPERILVFHRIAAFLATLVMFCSAAAARAGDDQIAPYLSGTYPHTLSRYTVLMDANSGKILYAQNPHAHREPASTTKMMAAIVLLENGRLSDTVTAPTGISKTPESSLHLSSGERISLEDLLYAMMLRSANDTPIAGASYLCGGVPPFVALMNAKAQAIGCSNTHFVTPNGLFDPDHYSCAADLALIARYGLTQLPMFREIVKTRERRIDRSIHKEDSLVVNTSLSFLKYFPGADGVKTGYISQAGHCFVGSATRAGWQLIAVALDSSKCRSDVVQMLSYGFKHFDPEMIAPAGEAVGGVSIGSRLVHGRLGGALWTALAVGHARPRISSYTRHVTLLAIPPAQAIRVGDKIGTISVFLGGKQIATGDIVAAEACAPQPASAVYGLMRRGSLKTVAVCAGSLLSALLAYFAIKVVTSINYARKTTKDPRLRRARIAKDL